MPPVYDFLLSNQGTIFSLVPLTPDAKQWVADKVALNEVQTLGRTIVIEHRYIGAIIDGIEQAGLLIQDADQPLC
jgi:hypothetical protein